MDATTCLKSLLLTMNEYRENRTTQNTAQLHKQVEEVSGLDWGRFLASGQVLPGECVSGLVDVAGDPNSSSALTGSIISLLAQLACDDDSRKILNSSFNLNSTLASIIHHHSAAQGEPLVLQCLQVLQKLTYNTRIFHLTNSIHELITFLITNIQSDNNDIIIPCLGLMANLCRDNHLVQSHIKSLDKVKSLYRTLINFLSHNSLTVVVFTLSILSSLTLNENVGEKLFNAKNIHQTFQLVFNIIVNGDGTLTQKYSVDLLVDLLKSPKIADYLSRYQHFSACVSQVMGLLHSKDPDSAAKVLELLLAMSGVSGLRSLLCDVVLQPAGPRLRVGGRRQAGPDCGGGAEPGLALVQWLSCPVEGAESCSLQTLQLLSRLLEEALGAEGVSECVLNFVDMLLPVLLGLLKSLDPAEGDAELQKHCTRITHTTNLLLVLCDEDSTRSSVSRQLSAQLCLSLVESLLSRCHSNNPLTCLPPGSDSDLSQVCAEALMKTLELMSKLRRQVKDMETSFYRTLQDQRMVTPLSLALTSHHRERVQTGLALLSEATPLPDFPSLVLGESIAANNAYRQREADLSGKRLAVQEVPPPRPNVSALDSSCSSSRSVHTLIERMESGLELQEQVEDLHVSEIINVYEQKLSAFAAKESRQQDLLEAKALVLSQADRLNTQYRFQLAQAEAEARKLGSLLKEAERRREDLQGELGSQVLEVERSKADIEELLRHNERLQRDSELHQGLKGAYNTLLLRFNETERLLKEITTQINALRKNHEALRLQHDKAVSALEEKEEKLQSLHSDLQQRESDITGLRGDLGAEQEKRKEKDLESRELEKTVDVLRKELNEMEQARKYASIRASSLELQKSQLETRLRQKEEELNKHSAMIAMIHSLSSNKTNSDVALTDPHTGNHVFK
ncbi:protein CIP2A isoform X2 [Genypterus blacodes]|uniref:protein CIP2A isoform X2 n=1 Tax=Genypterus blacodes TaxID=154954 RepID=UPI003F75C177